MYLDYICLDNTQHMVDDKIVDNGAAAFDEEELPDPDQFSEFMTGLLLLV